MRFICIATIVFTIGSLTAVPALAQDSDIDDLLNELNFGEEYSSEAPATETAVAIDEAASDSEVTGDVMVDESLFAEESMDVDAAAGDTVSDTSDEIFFEEMGADDAVTDDLAVEEVEEVSSQPILTEEPDESSVELAKLMAEQEEVRRQASEKKGNMNYEQGKQALAEGKYEQAAKLLEEARFNIPPRPANEEILEDIRVSLSEAYTEIARNQMNSDLNYARKSIDQALALAPENRAAQSTEKRILAKENKLAKEIARPKSITEQPQYAEKYMTIDDRLRNGRDLYNAKEYNDAEIEFEQVLIMDEYNVDAMRYLRRIEEERYEIKTKEREATVADMMAMVRDTWNPPIRTDVTVPQGRGGDTQIDTISAQEKLQKKMTDIIIPSIEFRSANITDVVNFLVDASVAGDPDGVGVNIILKLSVPGAETAAAAPAAPADTFGAFGDDFGFGSDIGSSTPAATSSYGANVPAITLNLRRINLLDAIKYITEVADLRFRLEDNVVIITPANVVSGRVITRMYPVQPSILDVIIEEDQTDTDTASGRVGDFIEMGGGTTKMQRSDVKDFFERAGVPFPVGTSITYNQSISQLIVANTVENLENFERILSRLNVIPNQVEIEARFVEVNQDDLEELGFQWFLTDDWEIAQKQGSGGPANTEAIVARADTDGLTKGNRFFALDSSSGKIQPSSTPLIGTAQTALGGIATFASVLTNPELTVIVTALSQKGGSDLLSAPRVTTRSGVNAQIQVVQEIIYPTDFTSESVGGDILQSINTSGNGLLPGGNVSDITSPQSIVVYPDTFSTREVGVILNVTPTVGPDGYTIDLALVPEVSELQDWIQYGQAPYNIPQPIFASRKVTTSIVVWDGQTVVLGGLIREDLVKYEDKVPLLGDLPLIGRLFRSKGEFSRKKNLLIFVTARLVGPDGKPIQREELLTTDMDEDATL